MKVAKPQPTFYETLPSHLRRASSCMSGDGGFKDWLDARFGAGKWALCEYPRGEIETAITHHEFHELAVEYGYGRLQAMFSNQPEMALTRGQE